MPPPAIWLAPFTALSILFMVGFGHGFNGVQSETCRYRKWSREGTLKVLVVAGLHENADGICGQWSDTAVAGVIALDWMMAKLNGNLTDGPSYIPGVSFGYDLYDNCNNPDLTTDLLYSGAEAGQQMQCAGEAGTQETYVAVMSLADIESTHVISHLTQPTLLLRPLPAAPGLEEKPNVIQNVASYEQEIQAIMSFLLHHNWTMIVVVHTADEYGTKSSSYFNEHSSKYDICVHLMAEPTTETMGAIYSTRTLTIDSTIAVVFFGDQTSADVFVNLSKKGNRPQGFRVIWIFNSLINTKPYNTSEDKFFSVQYPTLDFKDLEGYYNAIAKNTTYSPLYDIVTEYGNVIKTSKVSHVIDASFSLAHTVMNGSCYSGTNCELFKSLSQSRVKISDQSLDSFIPRSYQGLDKIIQYSEDGFQETERLIVYVGINEIGTFSKQSGFTSFKEFPDFSSACKDVCTGCRDKQAIRFSYLDGDVLILGLFSLRTYGDTPYSCGEYRGTLTDTIAVSAFMENILARRSTESIKYGGIALDDCYNGLNTTHILSELFSKRMVIRNPDNGAVIDFDKVILIIGALSSPVSITVADFATSVGLPMISYAASTPDLDNRNRYPFFFRTVPSDTQQVEGILTMISHIGVTHIGAVYIDDSYGKTGIQKLKEKAVSRHICVENPHAVTQAMLDDTQSNIILSNIIDKLYTQQVRVVVYFGIESIAEALLRQMPGSGKQRTPLIFIASEAWGKNQNVIAGDLGKKVIGTIVFNIAHRIEPNDAFKQYLRNLTFSEKKHNRWIPKFFEDYNKCNLITSFEKIQEVDGVLKLCGDDFEKSLRPTSVDTLYSEQRVVHIYHSIQAAIGGYTVFCNRPSSNPDCLSKVRQQTMSFVSDIKDNSEGLFNDDHNGNIGFTIYNIQLKETGGGDYSFDYVQIGSYSTEGLLDLTRQPVFYNDVQKNISLRGVPETDCTNYEETCKTACLFPTTTRAPEPTTTTAAVELPENDSNTMLVITIVLAVLLAIMAIALVLIIVVLLRRSPKKEEGYSMEHRRSMDNTYAVVSGEGHYIMPNTPRSAGQAVHRVSKSIDYADIRHRSYPDIRVNHVRQMSSPEVLQTTSLSSPHSRVRKSPASKKMLRPRSNGVRSDTTTPKTPLSVPAASTTLDRNYRYKPQSSPKFQYPNAQSESRYTYPTEEYPLSVHREEPRAEMDPENSEPEVFGSYITPSSGDTDGTKQESKLIYLTRNDLVLESSEDEEDCAGEVESANDTGYLSANPSSVINETNPSSVINEPSHSTVLTKCAYNPNLQSPSDNEVSKINFPSSTASQKSITEMPDVLRHGPYEEDDDNVFII